MPTNISSNRQVNSKHLWKFFRAGGFDQVYLSSGADLMALEQLDRKLWVALSCPTHALEFDRKTLEMIDTDGDGHIRVQEIIEALKWTGAILKNPDELTRGVPVLPLSSINDASPEGVQLLDSARHILSNLGKGDATEISVDDTADAAAIAAQGRFNGDGIIPADAADDPAVRQIIADIIDCLGADEDRSGKPGISQEKANQFFADAQAYLDWLKEAEKEAAVIMPLGEATSSAANAFATVHDKVNDYFTRCQLAAFDMRAISALNRREEEYQAIAAKNLYASLEDLSDFPLARVEARGILPLKEGINPAWTEAMMAFDAEVIRPLLGEKTGITPEEWERIGTIFEAYAGWLSRKAGAAVEKLGVARIREILQSNALGTIAALIARDRALDAEFRNVASVDRLVRYHRDLFKLANNFISFSDFYTRRNKAIFQAGTLYLDGRSCDLCVRVNDMGKHAALAPLGRIYLAYCDCTRGTEKMTIAAAFTDGDSDFLMVGRNGVFYDRRGDDWDATIVKVIEHPISIRQAFWSPYKKIARLIGSQIEKIASARDRGATDRATAAVAGTGQALESGKAPVPPFDIAKFAGIFAAIGLAIGAIGTAFAAAAGGFLKLLWWQMPLVLGGLVLIISGPSMILAWLKLRQRSLAPILDANGWAVNARVRINVAFGASLTRVAALPKDAVRKLEDPFVDKKSRWPVIVFLILVLLALLYMLNQWGLFYQWTSGLIGKNLR